MEITVQMGIKPEHKADATRLYASAFGSKFVKILGSQQEIIDLFVNGINENRGISALSSDNELLGIAGFNLNGKSLINIGFGDFVKQYGLIKGTIKMLMIVFIFDRKSDGKNQLLMDGIVVKEGNRGKGIGKQLFQKLEQYSKENNITSIKLDVIDENPKAKKLYEKIGFVSQKYQKVPQIIYNLVGVSGATTMVKEL